MQLKDIKSDGTNTAEIEKANEEKYVQWSYRIHDELLRRGKIRSPPQYDGYRQRTGIVQSPDNLPEYMSRFD